MINANRTRFVPGEIHSVDSALSESCISSVGRSGREFRPRSRLFDVNDDMWAHRSKTTERAAGVVGATASIHLSRGSDLFEAQSPAARNIPSGTSFVLLIARFTDEG